MPCHHIHSRATRAVTTVRIVDAKSSTVKSWIEECDKLGAIFVHLQFSVAYQVSTEEHRVKGSCVVRHDLPFKDRASSVNVFEVEQFAFRAPGFSNDSLFSSPRLTTHSLLLAKSYLWECRRKKLLAVYFLLKPNLSTKLKDT